MFDCFSFQKRQEILLSYCGVIYPKTATGKLYDSCITTSSKASADGQIGFINKIQAYATGKNALL